MKKTLDDTRAKLDKSEASVQKLEKESKEMKEEITQLQKDKKALESVAGDTASLKEQVADLSEQVKLKYKNIGIRPIWNVILNYQYNMCLISSPRIVNIRVEEIPELNLSCSSNYCWLF